MESLLDDLFVLKKKQEKLDVDLQDITAQVYQKESLIKIKEDEKSHLRATIEDDSAAHEQQFSKIRNQIEEQKELISTQRKHLNAL